MVDYRLCAGTVSHSLHTAEGGDELHPPLANRFSHFFPIWALQFDCHLPLPAIVLAVSCRFSPQVFRNIAFHISEISCFVCGKGFAYRLSEGMWGGCGYESRDESLITIRGEYHRIGNTDLAMIFRRPDS